MALHHRTHPRFVPGCFGCKAASIDLTIPYREQFHETTISEQFRDMDKRAKENGITYERAS
jgi:hypothetical protein